MTHLTLRTARAPICALALVLLGCTGTPEVTSGSTIDMDRFVAAWVELRASTISAPDGILTDELRESALERAEVTEEQLLAFAEAHGEDLSYMQAVWDSVQAQMEARTLGASDSTDSSEGDAGEPPPELR